MFDVCEAEGSKLLKTLYSRCSMVEEGERLSPLASYQGKRLAGWQDPLVGPCAIPRP